MKRVLWVAALLLMALVTAPAAKVFAQGPHQKGFHCTNTKCPICHPEIAKAAKAAKLAARQKAKIDRLEKQHKEDSLALAGKSVVVTGTLPTPPITSPQPTYVTTQGCRLEIISFPTPTGNRLDFGWKDSGDCQSIEVFGRLASVDYAGKRALSKRLRGTEIFHVRAHTSNGVIVQATITASPTCPKPQPVETFVSTTVETPAPAPVLVTPVMAPAPQAIYYPPSPQVSVSGGFHRLPRCQRSWYRRNAGWLIPLEIVAVGSACLIIKNFPHQENSSNNNQPPPNNNPHNSPPGTPGGDPGGP